jgi:hypothetical protein
VAGLLMARATGRAREIAVRSALGASRAQLFRQLLAESVLLAAAGAALGVLLAAWGVEWLVKADAGNNLPGYQPIRLDLAVLAFTVLVSMITGVLFGLVPAMQASRPDWNGVLRDGGRGTTGGSRGHRLRSLLVTAQMALSIVLLIGAGLLLQSFRQVRSVKLGFDPHHTLTARLAIQPARYPDGPRRALFVRRIEQSLRGIPGVTAAAISPSVPLAPPGAHPHPRGRPAGGPHGIAPARAMERRHARFLSRAGHPAPARPLFHLGRRREGAARRHRQRSPGPPLLAQRECLGKTHHLHPISGAV